MLFTFLSTQQSISANWVNSNSSEKPNERASPSFFIPDDIWLAFDAADYDRRQRFCSDEYTRKRISEFMPNPIPERVKGLNSRMDNHKDVEGFLELDKFAKHFRKRPGTFSDAEGENIVILLFVQEKPPKTSRRVLYETFMIVLKASQFNVQIVQAF